MAPARTETSSVFEGWEKWQIAVAVGAPICLGLAGLWFYNRSKQDGSSSPSSGKPKVESSGKEKVISPKQTSASAKQTTDKDVRRLYFVFIYFWVFLLNIHVECSQY